ncbi:hypothetical protein ITJ66_07265 [Plantibacter sp. VKM Ac-2885]|uniref:hypothetical protein n=1 Tax=Plantibacter sp. VKM Ac-2885 TaxID=2783828 RepID=UPI00188C4FD6|nr:hypothetical protein [Plantibacter sp. VKM Ac-2885]MBF4512287.1 hypothetical protein [Plantibacter sp. VKM Ac-2885]
MKESALLTDSDFNERIERVRKAAEVIGSLPTKALQTEAFHFLIGTRSGQPTSPGLHFEPHKVNLDGPAAGATTEQNPDTAKPEQKKSTPKKSKPASVNPDKQLELSPHGKQSFADFVAEKKPQTHMEKYTAAVFWILEIAEQPKATIAQIVTCYHSQKWNLPTDVRNTASQAGKKELDNSEGLDDIRLSNLGRNLITGLPQAEKK